MANWKGRDWYLEWEKDKEEREEKLAEFEQKTNAPNSSDNVYTINSSNDKNEDNTISMHTEDNKFTDNKSKEKTVKFYGYLKDEQGLYKIPLNNGKYQLSFLPPIAKTTNVTNKRWAKNNKTDSIINKDDYENGI